MNVKNNFYRKKCTTSMTSCTLYWYCPEEETLTVLEEEEDAYQMVCNEPW